MHEQIEEKALVEMLEQVIQTAKNALDCATEAHLVVPAIAYGLQSNGVDVIWDETAVRTGRMA